MARDLAPRPNFAALFLGAVPGLGHLVIGRTRKALQLFTAATFCLNLALLSALAPVPPLGDWSFRIGLGLGLLITVYGLVDIFRIGVYARLPGVTARRGQVLDEALGHYLRGEHAEARELLDQLLDIDPSDPLVRLHLAAIERRAGHPDRAIHHAAKALRAAPRSPFQPEIERELLLAREARRGR